MSFLIELVVDIALELVARAAALLFGERKKA